MHMTIASSWNQIPWQCKEGAYAISEVGARTRFSNTACSDENSMQALHAAEHIYKFSWHGDGD